MTCPCTTVAWTRFDNVHPKKKKFSTYFGLEDDAMLKGFIRMKGNPQVEIVIRHLAIGLLATFIERHSLHNCFGEFY